MARAKPGAGPTPPVRPRSAVRPAFSPEGTRPIAGSPYPLTLVAEGEDPRARGAIYMGVIMVIMVLAAYFVVVQLVNTAVVYLGYLVERPGTDWATYGGVAQAFGTPWGILGAHLGLGAMTLAVWALARTMHHRRMRWIWSVSPGVRWRYGVLCLGVAVIVVGAVTAYQWVTGPGWAAGTGWGWYAVVIVVTTPLQALAEEVMFRGYLMQAFGAIVRNVWVPILATALVFAAFHGLQNPWLFADRLLFGILAGVLVWRTGGLEAGIAIHIVNNLGAFGLGLATGTLSQLRTTTAVGWTQTVQDLTMFAICAVACWGIAVGLRVPMKVRQARA